MEDVVFAGTAGRPPLGRAEVTLTIDNSDGALPIDYAEVTITRLLFRTGQSEYAINGDQCRLLDIRTAVRLRHRPGDARHRRPGPARRGAATRAPTRAAALIEEAAGVLKHRSRKEKAVRKLDAMQANLTRLVDLTAELRRRLKPLGRQAEIARRAAVIQADLRDARLRLLADDYATLAAELQQDETDEAARRRGAPRSRPALSRARQQERTLEKPSSSTRRGWPRPRRPSSRCPACRADPRGARLAAERHRHLSARRSRSAARPRPRGAGAEAADCASRNALASDWPPPGAADHGGSRPDQGRGRAHRERAQARGRRQGRGPAGRAAGPVAQPGDAASSRATRRRRKPAGWPRPAPRPGPGRAGPGRVHASRTWSPAGSEGRADLTGRTSSGRRGRPRRGVTGYGRQSTPPARAGRAPGPGRGAAGGGQQGRRRIRVAAGWPAGSPACSARWPSCSPWPTERRKRSPPRWAPRPARLPSPTWTPRPPSWPR